ncbi:MAG: hypothetical protein FJW64_10975 [Actinobacteria bacterium]|nr:hypothetical protein [Actinomycetota bacterium]
MGYATPASVGISDDRDEHLARRSLEPGTDYMTAYGTDLRMPAAGTVVYVDNDPAGAEGRRLQINLDDGRVVDMIHLHRIHVKAGTRVARGQTGVCQSGGSGFGKDRHYEPHVHVTLRARTGLAYSQTIDFEDFVGDEAGAPAFPLPSGCYFGPKEGPRESVSGYFSHREDLRRWQQRMADRGWPIKPDGLYGDQTGDIAEAFQTEKGLVVDRKIGPSTWAAAWTSPVT